MVVEKTDLARAGVIHDPVHFLGVAVGRVHQLGHETHPRSGVVVVLDAQLAPATPRRMYFESWQRCPLAAAKVWLFHQLLGGLVQAYDGIVCVVGLLVAVEHLLHLADIRPHFAWPSSPFSPDFPSLAKTSRPSQPESFIFSIRKLLRDEYNSDKPRHFAVPGLVALSGWSLSEEGLPRPAVSQR